MAEVCVLVGAGPSLGAGLAWKFAREGCRMALVSRDRDALAALEAELRAAGLEATAFPADAADPESVAACFAAIRGRLGDPEILLYNAAIVEPATLSDADFDYVMRCFGANAGGALLCAQQVIPAMRRNRRGSILFSGGVLAFEPILGWGVTAIGKAALRNMALVLDQELRGDGIHVASVAIHGGIQTDPFYAPDRIADAFWTLHRQQPASAFEREMHFKRPD
ncbi:NAD(P)-dependent dehydrogenase (short-subunit alcohol dehydrogenase family) [Sphingobium wenxiniae]|uniref:Short subunit dehydrogenase n=1 Tax=Sphingobium wenxiniae (strain DSM 21828 / CGMCC 1.7748 / JZ-1) TaxID=595605 RepID=A0A562KMS6_SPHWJ|nr:SDR family NAD(P)-dependent oxidoreductase [Sphingobium wenxiniae]MBB6191928.1 NAD(P)-dependent dehydrogenase (short-subunit alcohol dehydrogenase family) [Sphingobium wenxiniae]TWH96647.1 short subunit dehydrogenase [Sphingobium wenxiniae]